jgi:Xaa-Pro aminopeptidase
MRQLCERVANADAAGDGTLRVEGTPLTSERMRSLAAILFLDRGFSMGHGAIVATTPQVADCHHAGSGPLRTGEPVIIDLFPRDDATRYWGDCTRTVVHGQPSDVVVAMHRAVVEAKQAANALLAPGVTAERVHLASENMLRKHGFSASRGTITDYPSIQHGTGHGIGLDVHEPILLDIGGGPVFPGEVFTIEPGLYGRNVGGVRVEDMLVVTEDGCRTLNSLPAGLDWRSA